MQGEEALPLDESFGPMRRSPLNSFKNKRIQMVAMKNQVFFECRNPSKAG